MQPISKLECRRCWIDVRPTAIVSTGHPYTHLSRAASQGTRRLPYHAAHLAALGRSWWRRNWNLLLRCVWLENVHSRPQNFAGLEDLTPLPLPWPGPISSIFNPQQALVYTHKNDGERSVGNIRTDTTDYIAVLANVIGNYTPNGSAVCF